MSFELKTGGAEAARETPENQAETLAKHPNGQAKMLANIEGKNIMKEAAVDNVRQQLNALVGKQGPIMPGDLQNLSRAIKFGSVNSLDLRNITVQLDSMSANRLNAALGMKPNDPGAFRLLSYRGDQIVTALQQKGKI